ncbi:MAG TPA: hypothetical protein VFK41_12060 [Nocardioidaceae bacterium]|nr:hypothetical protein [Nocardioidaceae bacterium]
MVTEIRDALRSTADAAAVDLHPLEEVVAAGSRRVRHRRVVTGLGTTGLALAIAVGAATLTVDDDRADVPLPANLTLDDAKPASLEVLSSRTAPWDVPDDADGVPAFTEDRLVVQGRGRLGKGTFQLGLLDPDAGTTDWLPQPPTPLGQLSAVELGARRLLYFDWQGNRELSVLQFDRDSRSWSRAAIDVPRGDYDPLFGAVPPQLASDGRLYLLDPDNARRWYSVPSTGGTVRPEPSLEGTWASWSGSMRATGDGEGRIVVTRDGQPVAEVEGPPESCSKQQTVPTIPPLVAFVGSRFVATFTCGDGNQVVVYDESGRVEIMLAVTKELRVDAAGDGHLLLSDARRLYLLNLDSQELTWVDTMQPRETPDADLEAGLVVWDTVVWNTERDAWDTVHKVARLP